MAPERVAALVAKLETEQRIGPAEAGQVLGKSVHWVYKQSAAGRLPHYKNGKRNEYLKSELLEWLAAQARGARGAT